MPPSAVYSAGFEGRTVATLYRGAIMMGGTVLDIRMLAELLSLGEWSGQEMQKLMGGYYRPLPAWGNTRHDGDARGVRINNFEAGRAQFEAMSGPIILLTSSGDDQTGHRAAIARMILPLGYTVEPFPWEDFEGEEPGLF
jgi:hypothetical protein